MPKVAFYTFGILREPREHPMTKEFTDRSPLVYASAEHSDGFVDRAPQRIREKQDPRWGDRLAEPRFVVHEKDAIAPATISLWEDLESVYAFAYYGRHAEALSKREEWFRKPEWPTYVAWWVDDDHIPAREEAVAKLGTAARPRRDPGCLQFQDPLRRKWQPLPYGPG